MVLIKPEKRTAAVIGERIKNINNGVGKPLQSVNACASDLVLLIGFIIIAKFFADKFPFQTQPIASIKIKGMK